MYDYLVVGSGLYGSIFARETSNKGFYTEKQWGRDCKDLSVFIIKQLPVRLILNNNWFPNN